VLSLRGVTSTLMVSGFQRTGTAQNYPQLQSGPLPARADREERQSAYLYVKGRQWSFTGALVSRIEEYYTDGATQFANPALKPEVLTSEHSETDEAGTSHEELFYVARGRATFLVEGEEVDAPAGTFVYVRDPDVRRGAVAREPGTVVFVAGGAESMSLIPMGGSKPSPNPWLAENYPASLLTMGLTAERVARHYEVSRADQDAFALASHRKALAAQAAGRFADELIPVAVTTSIPGSKPGKPEVSETPFSADEGPRADSSLEALAKLKPAFHAEGTVTAGNSSQTSDGAAATVLMEAGRARELGIRPIGRLLAYAATGCLPEEMGMGPVSAIRKVLRIAGFTLSDISLIELNEAFAAQALAVIRELGLDPERVNVNGGAIALGHPLGCTGSKLTATLLAELRRRKLHYGMVTMCVGGGMGAAAIFEVLI